METVQRVFNMINKENIYLGIVELKIFNNKTKGIPEVQRRK